MRNNIIFAFLVLALSTTAIIGCGPEVTTVDLDPLKIHFKKKDQTRTLEAKALNIRDQVVKGITFSYSSENPSIATVNENGVVKAAGNGSTSIIAKSNVGKATGEAFVSVCLPKEIICDPADGLKLRVGVQSPIICHITDCKDKKIPGQIKMEADPKMVLKQDENIFVGLAVGDTTAKITAFDLETTVKIHIDEQNFLPGMDPRKSGGKKGGKRGRGNKDEGNAYGSGGRFDHIIENM